MTPFIAMPAVAGSIVEAGGATSGTLPELPVLSAMLRGATRLPFTGDWRSGVLDGLSMHVLAGAASATVAACAVPELARGVGICFALPVHAIAGMSRMYLAGGDAFTLDAAERAALLLAFNAEFGSAEVRLHGVGTGWLLEAPFAQAADDGDPGQLVGTALAREPARSDAGRALRRLGAEVEMWLAGLPLNRKRENRGAPPINSFWFWGGSGAGTLPPCRMIASMVSNAGPDAWMAGLASHCGKSVQQANSWGDVQDPAAALIMLQPLLLGDTLRQLPAWEAAWFEPVQRELAARRLPGLRLQIGATAWQLPAPRLTRWLRRAQPWWQAVA